MIREFAKIEQGSFIPLVFNTLGGIGPAASVVYKRISSMIAEKSGQSYNSVIRLIRCKLTFSLLRSTITCLRGITVALLIQSPRHCC